MALRNWLIFASTIVLGAAPAAAAPVDVTPVADHHQHLFSPMLANKINGALAPDAVVPPTIRSFLGRREAAWNDPKALRKLVTNDVETVTRSRSGWIRGGDKVADYLGTLFGRAVTYTPTQIRVHGNSAELSGYYTRGSGAERQTLGFFQMSLERGPAGWRMSREVPIFPFPEEQKPITADDLIALLDAAGIRKAVVLSEAFWWDSPPLRDSDPLDEVRAENEWTAQQVAKYPDRLVAFCSFTPLASYALAELDRCAADKRFRGLKLSFAMSGIDITKPEHLAAVQALFRAANRRRLPITVHLSSGRAMARSMRACSSTRSSRWRPISTCRLPICGAARRSASRRSTSSSTRSAAGSRGLHICISTPPRSGRRAARRISRRRRRRSARSGWGAYDTVRMPLSMAG